MAALNVFSGLTLSGAVGVYGNLLGGILGNISSSGKKETSTESRAQTFCVCHLISYPIDCNSVPERRSALSRPAPESLSILRFLPDEVVENFPS